MTTDITVENLRQSRVYIDRGWTQRASARDEGGHPCSSTSEQAVSWCMIGAVNRALEEAPIENMEEVWRALRRALMALHPSSKPMTLEGYNDKAGTKKADVRLIFDTAIEAESDKLEEGRK